MNMIHEELAGLRLRDLDAGLIPVIIAVLEIVKQQIDE